MEQKPIKKKMCHTIFSSSILFLIITSHYAIAGPVIRSSRMVREIYPEIEQEIPDSSQTQVCIVGDVVYGAGEGVPAEQPCLKCACAPPEVRCETEICVQQPGCKTIHRPNKCCPDYQCECQHEGKSYANGERLPASPGGECLVCYCRGGEVQCAEVGCYTRSDCEPRYVSGQCCPKYDHCPPRESNTNQHDPPNGSPDQDIISSWPMASVPENLTSLETEEGSGDVSPDDFYSSSTTPNSIQSDEPKRSQTPITFSIKDYDSKTKKPDLSPPEKTDKSTQTDLEHRPQITIQEVIPAMTEFKITSPPQKEVAQKAVSISPINPVTYKGVEVTSNPNDNDVESYASEKTEVYVHPSPVLRIGDQLLFIKHGQLVPEKDASTPSPVITLIGAEGLQIGLGSGELLDHEIIPVNREESTSNPVGKQLDVVTSSVSDQSSESTSSSEVSTSSPTEPSSLELENESTTSELTSSPNPTETSSPKLEVLSTEDIFESSSKESSLPDTSAEYIPLNSTEFDYNLTETKSSEFEFSSTESLTNITDDESYRSTEISTDLSTDSSSPKIETSTPEGKTPNMEYIPEENPYYPPIPEDIMNLGHDDAMPDSSTTKHMPDVSSESSASTEIFDFENNSSVESSDIPKSRNRILLHMKSVEDKEFVTPTPDVLPADKILPDVLEIRSNKSIPKNTTQEWLKTEDPVKILIPLNDKKIPLINEKAALPQELLNEPVPSDFLNDEPIPSILNSFKTIDQILTTTEAFSDEPQTELSSTASLPEATVTSDDSQKIVLPTQEQLHSKETIEDELYSSDESTTVKSQPMPFLENDDASIEIIQNDSGVDNTDLVEMLPGFERSTPKAIETSEEHLDTPKDEVEMISKSAEEPESHLDLTVESVKQPESHVVEVKETREELKDFHEEIQKRDVVKKVLKDTFDNPKENIRTELIGPEEHALSLAQDETDDELNVVKPDFHDLSTRSLNTSIFIPTSSTNATVQTPNLTPDTEVIQKVATDNAVKSSDSTETLDTGALGVLRDFFQSQFRHYQDSRSTTE